LVRDVQDFPINQGHSHSKHILEKKKGPGEHSQTGWDSGASWVGRVEGAVHWEGQVGSLGPRLSPDQHSLTFLFQTLRSKMMLSETTPHGSPSLLAWLSQQTLPALFSLKALGTAWGFGLEKGEVKGQGTCAEASFTLLAAHVGPHRPSYLFSLTENSGMGTTGPSALPDLQAHLYWTLRNTWALESSPSPIITMKPGQVDSHQVCLLNLST
jgi:hypothetical protein